MDEAGWRVLRPGRPDELVLAVDYWPGRSGAGFPELAAALQTSATVLEAVPPWPGETLGGAVRYLQRWTSGIDRSAVALVLGNCVGAGFAVTLAAHLAEDAGVAPPVMVFDPELADAATLRAEFGRMTAGFGAPDAEDPLPGGDLADRVEQLAAHYAVLAQRFGAGDEAFDDEYVAELVAQGRRYLGYLAAAAELDTAAVPPALVAMASRTGCSGLGMAGRTVRFDSDRAGLLAHPEVVQAVNDMIGVSR